MLTLLSIYKHSSRLHLTPEQTYPLSVGTPCSCSDDEHQTSLKWNSSSHPVAPECRVSHTLRL